MKILRLRAHGFRAFSDPIEIDLNADVIVLSGPNGQGKTSLLDAILWALSGSITRFEGTGEEIVSMYSATGEAEVELEIGVGGKRWTIRRAWDGEAQRLHLSGPSESSSGKEAALELSRLLHLPEGTSDSPDLVATGLHRTLTRAIYLQQDLVREFVEADDQTSRYESLSQLFGTRRVVDLQLELERQKANWSKSLNTDKQAASSVDEELSRVDAEIESLQADAGQVVSTDAWEEWWNDVDTIRESEDPPPAMSSSEAPVALDRVLRSVESERRRVERRLLALEELIIDVPPLTESHVSTSTLDDLRKEVEAKQQRKAELENHLQSAEAALVESRRAAARVHDEAEDRVLFATLALRHLGEVCPVCQQSYDRQAAEGRLQRVASAQSEGPKLPDMQHVHRLREELRAAEEARALVRQEFEAATEAHRKLERLKSRLRDEEASDIAESPAREWSRLLSHRSTSMEAVIARLRRLQEEGERLSLTIARASEAARLQSLQREREATYRRLNELRRNLHAREETGSLAQEMIEGLREASQTIVSKELNRIKPIAQRVYSAIDPHPALRRIDISATMFRGRGHVTTSVKDPNTSAVSKRPDQVLSSSQLNALALSLFIAMNVGARDLPLHSLVLDDPLQSLDDINLLGLVDVLRRLAGSRQIVVSTHDVRFADLLERKLRPVRPIERTLSVAVDSWSREGPEIRVREVERPRELFVVA